MMTTHPSLLTRVRLFSVALVGALVLVVMGVFVTLNEEDTYRYEKVQEAAAQAKILAASVTAALVFNDKNAAQEYVTALQANPEIEAAGVYDTGGKRISGFIRQGGEALPDKTEVRPAYIANNRIFIAMPVRQGQTVVGVVYLRAMLDSLTRRIARYSGIMLLVTMAILVLGGTALVQRALAQTNLVLQRQTSDLVEANEKLTTEMEERAKAEDALRQSQKMEAIGHLSGGIAHDFNNLITIIKGNLQLLQRRRAQGQTDIQRYIDAALEGLNRASSLTQRILAFSRHQPLSSQPVHLSSLINGMPDLIRHSLGESIKIETRLGADWTTLCDKNQMENVIINLLVNARDAMPDGGTVTIETENVQVKQSLDGIAAGEYVRLSIRDTGTGMSDEVRQKAVDPFFTTKPQGRGTGLGLSMAFGFVGQSNGQFAIHSELGKGTTIVILMPRDSAETLPTRA